MKSLITTTALLGILATTAAITRAQEQAPPPPPVPAANEKAALELQERARAQADAAQAEKLRAEKAMIEQQLHRRYERAIAEDPQHAWVRALHPNTGKKENLPYCGVATVEVMPALTEQLKLSPGMGLLVDFVEPNSPAEAAGVKQYDVLLKFNDQQLVNPDQLRTLVRMKMPSDDVKFAIIRRGEPTTANVELGQKEVEVEADATNPTALPPALLNINTITRDGQFRVNGNVVNANARAGVAGAGGGAVAGGGGGDPHGQFYITTRDGGAMIGGGGAVAFTNAAGKNQMVWKDAQNSLSLELQDGRAVNLVAKDRDGKEIFNGPVETDAQRAALPADLAEKLKKAEQGGPIRAAVALDRASTGPRVLTSTENDTLLLARFEKGKAIHAFAFATVDGKTLFDGPTVDDAQRKAMPEAVAKQLESLEKNQNAATDFGVVGRN